MGASAKVAVPEVFTGGSRECEAAKAKPANSALARGMAHMPTQQLGSNLVWAFQSTSPHSIQTFQSQREVPQYHPANQSLEMENKSFWPMKGPIRGLV